PTSRVPASAASLAPGCSAMPPAPSASTSRAPGTSGIDSPTSSRERRWAAAASWYAPATASGTPQPPAPRGFRWSPTWRRPSTPLSQPANPVRFGGVTATPHVPKRFIPFGAALLLAGCGRPGGPQAPSPDARGELLAPGDTRAGALTLASPQFSDGSRYALFAFTARPGDTLTARLTSDDFDPFLIVADAHGNSLRKDDDDGGACNAQITFTPPSPAQPAAAEPSGAPVYRLYVNSAAKAELGTFQLSLVRGPGVAPADTSCRGFGGVKGLIQIGQTITDSLTAGDPLFTSDS